MGNVRATRRPRVPNGFDILWELQPIKPETLPKVTVTSDSDVLDVKHELDRIAGSSSRLESRIGDVLRRALDKSYDGANTGRFHLEQLSKTEKAHTGTLFEVELQQEFDLPDGHDTDYQVLQFDVDAKYSHGKSWMIGPEIEGNLALLATADDYKGEWSAWLVWVKPGRRNSGANRDAKSSLNLSGREARVVIAEHSKLPPNNLLARPNDAFEVMRRSGTRQGTQRINELCRRFDGVLLSRSTVATVAQQLDPTKRMRENGGARTHLAPEGIIVVGFEHHYRVVTDALGLPHPANGEFLPLRVNPASQNEVEAHFIDADGNRWRRARPGEAPDGVPRLVAG